MKDRRAHSFELWLNENKYHDGKFDCQPQRRTNLQPSMKIPKSYTVDILKKAHSGKDVDVKSSARI